MTASARRPISPVTSGRILVVTHEPQVWTSLSAMVRSVRFVPGCTKQRALAALSALCDLVVSVSC
jgi:hypothetical protein